MNKAAVLVLLLLISGCSTGNTVAINEKVFKVEIADNAQSRALGLMFREHLDEDKGMLFIFDDEAERYFWMKNTKMPLGMIFMDKDGIILNIVTAEPCKEDPCQSYASEDKAKYVLEINAGESKNIGVGEKAEIS